MFQRNSGQYSVNIFRYTVSLKSQLCALRLVKRHENQLHLASLVSILVWHIFLNLCLVE